jgi:hypothetical protein
VGLLLPNALSPSLPSLLRLQGASGEVRVNDTKLPLNSLDAALVRQVASGGRMSGNDAETLHAIANAIDAACEASEEPFATRGLDAEGEQIFANRSDATTCGVFLKSNATTKFQIGDRIYLEGEVLGQSPDLQRVNIAVVGGLDGIFDVADGHIFLEKNVTEQSKCPDNWLDLDALQDAGRLSQDVASSVEEMPAVLEPRAAASDAATAAHKYVQSVIDNADVWTEEWAENVFIAGWRQATSQASGPMMTAHGEGADTALHPTDRPCAKCRPPVVITDAMVERANKAYCDALYEAADGSPKALGHWADHHPARNVMRAALEAALNG